MKIRHDEQMTVNGKLTQIGFSFRTKVGQQIHRVAVFSCECGNKIIVSPSVVRLHQKTCGCDSRNRIGKASLIHGHAKRGKHSPEFKTWANMKKRCENASYEHFQHYGGRGITICERWQNFELFFEDMGERPQGASIDRIDPNGNYEPLNCVWESRAQQALNKRNAVWLVIDGVTKRLKDWVTVEGAGTERQVRLRRYRGWNDKDAVFGRQK